MTNHARSLSQTTLAVLIVLLLAACGTPAQPAAVTIYYEENAQVELINSEGRRVLIDVFDPPSLTSPATAEDISLTTHSHQDHVNADFLDSFPGQQLYIREGEITLPDVTIKGIASAHSAHNTPQPEGGSNYIFILDMDGLRIAHFGDIGQDELTQEQIDMLGEVDVAIMQLVNSYSQMNMVNKKGFNLMAQVEPKLIIPTHGGSDMEAIEYAMELWEASVVSEGGATVGRSDLSGQTRLLLVGQMAPSFQSIYDLPEWQ